jgi:hypothetical protein
MERYRWQITNPLDRTMTRDETIKEIRAALKRRTGKLFSVTGGKKGTAWGWIRIDAPPKIRDTDEGNNWRKELHAALNLGDRFTTDSGHAYSIDIPAAYDFRQEYIDRANGRPPSVIGKHYWD